MFWIRSIRELESRNNWNRIDSARRVSQYVESKFNIEKKNRREISVRTVVVDSFG